LSLYDYIKKRPLTFSALWQLFFAITFAICNNCFSAGNTHFSLHEKCATYNISLTSVNKIIKYDMQVKCMLLRCRSPLPGSHLTVPVLSIFMRAVSPTNISSFLKQVAQLSQRDRTAGWVSNGLKWKTGTERQYLRTI